MANLLELSHELLHCVFTETSPRDLSNLSRSCRAFHDYIKGNRLLHKEVCLLRYDEARREESTDWERRLHSLFRLEQVLASKQTTEQKREYLGFVSEQICHLVATAHPDAEQSRNIRLLSSAFEECQHNIDAFLCSSSIFDSSRAGYGGRQVAAKSKKLRHASAKLHCLYGVPIDVPPRRSIFSMLQPDLTLAPSSSTRSRAGPAPATHLWARSRVYDLREYTEETMWGPFLDDGSHSVDWEKIESVMIVLGHNLRKFGENHLPRIDKLWKDTFRGASPSSYCSPADVVLPAEATIASQQLDGESVMYKIRELQTSLDALDPYGVTGSWMRVVCFLDYNDLYAFNFSEAALTTRDRGPVDTDEAIRLIRIKLHVTRILPPDAVLEPGDPWANDDARTPAPDWSNFKGTRLPIVHFRGSSRSMHASWDPNANSRIRGTVRQTPEGEIRWTTFSVFHGEERWRSEGIQVGGLKSARGVLGNWFEKDYDDHGPAGPTAFWKESDEIDLEDPRTLHAMH